MQITFLNQLTSLQSGVRKHQNFLDSTADLKGKDFWRKLWKKYPSFRSDLLNDKKAQLAIFLTVSKFPLAFLAAIFAITGYLQPLAYLILASIIIDIFDGIIYRNSRLGRTGKWVAERAIVDAHGDRVLMIGVVLPIFLFYGLPSFVFFSLLIREIVLGVLLALPFYRNGTVYKPNLPSRIATALIGIYGFLFCLEKTGLNSGVLESLFIGFLFFAGIGCLNYWLHPAQRNL